jgi:LPXTG-motif cell wall-anchored protein
MPRLGQDDNNPNWMAWLGLAVALLALAYVLATRH